MKKLLMAIALFSNLVGFAQSDIDESTPKKLVEDFFEAFHKQDTVTLKSFALEGMKLESISEDTEGKANITSEDYTKFLKNIASIPVGVSFEEKLHEFRIEENGLIATVTTPYSFYFNGNLSHCGVNSFQLVKLENEWKIIHLMDTRKKDDCD